MNTEQILKKLKDLDLTSRDIRIFFDQRVSFILKIRPCKKRTRYTISTFINIASDYEEKDVVENIADLISESTDLNFTFFREKTDKDTKKTILFDCDFNYGKGLANFDTEINLREFNIINNAFLKFYEFFRYITDNIEDETTNNNNNVIYLNALK